MDEEQVGQLDKDVAEVLADLQATGEPITAETVRSRVGKRMTDVLAAMKRVRGTPVDHETPIEDDAAVVGAISEVKRRRALLAQAERLLAEAEGRLAEAEREALTGEALIDLRPQRQAVDDARHQVSLQAHGVERALAAGGEAFRHAAEAHYQARWSQYQQAVSALLEPLRASHAAQAAVYGAYSALRTSARAAGIEVDVLPACRPGLDNALNFCRELEGTILRQAAPMTP